MTYHILNGDSLAYSFPDASIEGEVVVVREALIDGDLTGDSFDDFWQLRASHLEVAQDEYYDKTVREFERILDASDDSEFNLWFEYDLFCQVNMWFVISLIDCLRIGKKVYAVYSSHLDRSSKHFWNGFGPANSEDLRICFARRISLNEADLRLGTDLWVAYRNGDHEQLLRLADNQSSTFPYLKEVVKAHVDRFPMDGSPGRPERIIREIIQNGTTAFPEVFKEFWSRESIYGFGDTQLKHLFDKVMQEQ